MTAATLFSLINMAAMLCWVCLIFLPKWQVLITIIKYGVISAFALLYSVLIFVYFFKIEGGGFGSIAQVRLLFSSDYGLLAGWVHYLAFDLFVGLWIVKEADKVGLHRFLQAPILLLTFMFGPVGLLTFYACKGSFLKYGKSYEN
jgi:hypothetical protein